MIVEHLKNPEQLFDVEFRLKTKSGEYKWINGRGKVVELNQDGKPKRMIGSHVDLSERKKAEEKILALNQQLVSLNSDLEIRVAKRTYELQNALKHLEDSNEELISMNEQASIDSENILKLNEELIASEIELKKVLAAKDKFFSVIAHELKTPFSGFLLLSDMMAKDFDEISVKDMKKIAITINNSATSLYNLLESLLQWSRIQLGEVPIKYENVDLHEIASNIIYLFNNHAKEKEIEVVNLIPKNTLVYCDRNTITSVFRNLVSNSLKFTNKDGFVEIGLNPANETNNAPTFYVKDSGVGIPQKALERIFEIDSHFSTKGTNNEAGSGLGLTLCKEFIDKHKGHIAIESKVGKGTMVSFTINVDEKT